MNISFFAIAVLAAFAPAALSAPATPAPAAKATPAPEAERKQVRELSPALQKARELLEKKDAEGALKILRTEAEKGDARAANGAGELCLSGRGTKASPAEAANG